MNLREKYYELQQFLGSYFPYYLIYNTSDEDIVSAYTEDCDTTILHQTIMELELVILDIGVWWQEIREESNRYLETEEDALEWLLSLKELLQKSYDNKIMSS